MPTNDLLDRLAQMQVNSLVSNQYRPQNALETLFGNNQNLINSLARQQMFRNNQSYSRELTAQKPNRNYGYGKRLDGTEKGRGWLGEIPMKDGRFMTELSIGVDFGGKEVLIPAIVPTLTKEEIQHLSSGGELTDEIIRKAVEHAKIRMSNGYSPFAD